MISRAGIFKILIALAIFLTGFLLGDKFSHKDIKPFNAGTLRGANAINLPSSYFDDFKGVWGSGLSNGGIKYEAGDSKYAERSAPIPIIHPLELKTESIKISSIDDYFSSRSETVGKPILADVDRDGKKEQIVLTANEAGNHPYHNGYIVKNGQIILYVPLNNGSIEASTDGNGFYVKTIPLEDKFLKLGACCSSGYRLYRVIYQNNEFKAVWEQEIMYLRVAD